MSQRIFMSFSGGRSSARMYALVREQYPDAEIVCIFANTGEEHWKTLEFVDRCDKHFGMNLVWVEAVVHPGKKASTHRVVSYETASRKGEPFEAVIAKYGITNKAFPHCTRETKLNPMYSYIKSLGWKKGTYLVAIGIRADEPKRLDKKAAKKRIIYPLVTADIDKADVLDYWAEMPFDLEIAEHEGNCKWCWKKSDPKHVMNIQANRGWYDFPRLMELKYGLARTDLGPEPRVFFRNRRSTEQMLALADALEPPRPEMLNRPDEDAGCAEECHIEPQETD